MVLGIILIGGAWGCGSSDPTLSKAGVKFTFPVGWKTMACPPDVVCRQRPGNAAEGVPQGVLMVGVPQSMEERLFKRQINTMRRQLPNEAYERREQIGGLEWTVFGVNKEMGSARVVDTAYLGWSDGVFYQMGHVVAASAQGDILPVIHKALESYQIVSN